MSQQSLIKYVEYTDSMTSSDSEKSLTLRIKTETDSDTSRISPPLFSPPIECETEKIDETEKTKEKNTIVK